MNRLCEVLGVEIPIIQAPTGSVAGPDLCAAVSQAGGLGSMGVTWTEPTDAAALVKEVRSRANRPFVVNYALAFEPAGLTAALEAGAPVVTFSWGDPAPYVEVVRRAGAKVGIQVGSPAGVRRAVELGADFVICQGIEAGGHVQSSTSLDALLAESENSAGAIPVVAAGGLANGADIARVMRSGASGVMLGTRFVATVESAAHEVYKNSLLAARSDDAALTMCFDGGWPNAPHRTLRNGTLEQWEAAGCPQPGSRPGEGETVGFSAAGEPINRYEDTAPRVGMTGRLDEMAMYAGVGVGDIRDLPHATDLVRRLWAEAREKLNI